MNIAYSALLHRRYNYLTCWILFRILKIVETGTAPTATICIEGRPGIGKTAYATICMFGSLVLLAFLIERKVTSFDVGSERVRVPSLSELEEVYPDMAHAVEALLHNDPKPAIEYVKQYVCFTPFELLKLQKKILKEKYPAPFLLLDDAGSFFCRSGWVGFPKEWKQAISLVIANLPMIRTLAGTFLITTPTIRTILTGLVRFVDRTLLITKLDKKRKTIILDKIVELDKGAYYHVKQYRAFGGQRAEVFVRIKIGGETLHPIAYPDLDLVQPILDYVWEIRKEWMTHLTTKAEYLMKKAEEELPAGSPLLRKLIGIEDVETEEEVESETEEKSEE